MTTVSSSPRGTRWLTALLFVARCLLPAANAQGYAVDTPDNIRASAKTLAHDVMQFYKGNQTGEIPGILPGPPSDGLGDYYWWEGGALMGTMIDYWHLTGDTTYNDVVTQGILHQVGDKRDFQPRNYTASLGNDDQGFWGMTAMLAAENKFPNPPDDQPQWLALAQAVWVTQAAPERHDETCNGGLRWQIPLANNGYDYKNTIANAIFFNLGARLARYTQNSTYAHWATTQFQWLWDVNYIDHESWKAYDGGHVAHNCTDINKAQFSYNAAILAQGAAFMYNYTAETSPEKSDLWKTRVSKLTEGLLRDFFPQKIAFELPCETRHGACTPDMLSFKGYVHRWVAVIAQVAPFLRDTILPVLKTSAEAAAKQCTGGSTGRVCGFYWSEGVFVDPGVDKTTGAGEAMDVLAAVSSLLVEEADPPATNGTGGISKGDPDAGTSSVGGKGGEEGKMKPVTTADKAGAAICTVLLLAGGMAVWVFMNLGD